MALPPVLGPRIALLQNARLAGQPDLVDVHITPQGNIAAVQPAAGQFSTERGATTSCSDGCMLSLDVAGALVVPALLDGHIHPDKTLLGLAPQVVDRLLAESGHVPTTVQGRISREIAVRPAANAELNVESRARNMLAACAAKGTLRVRAHADVDAYVGLEQLRAVSRAADTYRGVVDVQLVAFPQSGVCGTHPGAKGVSSLLRAAVAEFPGVVIGGLDPITIDGALDAQLHVVFELAALVCFLTT